MRAVVYVLICSLSMRRAGAWVGRGGRRLSGSKLAFACHMSTALAHWAQWITLRSTVVRSQVRTHSRLGGTHVVALSLGNPFSQRDNSRNFQFRIN